MNGSKDRIERIVAIVGDDEVALKLIKDVLDKCVGYVSVVFNAEVTLSTQRQRLEGYELKEPTERLDSLRRIAHNALIDNIRICNRYLFKTFGADTIPAGGIYSYDPRHLTDDSYRSAIGDWACEVIVAYFASRKR